MGREAAHRSDTGAGTTPFGINLAAGAVTVLAATIAAAALFPQADTMTRLLVVASAVAGFTATVDDLRTCLPVTGLGYLLFNGFLTNTHGTLTWDPATSRWHVAALATAATAGTALRWARRLRKEAATDAELQWLAGGDNDPAPPADRRQAD